MDKNAPPSPAEGLLFVAYGLAIVVLGAWVAAEMRLELLLK